MSTTVRWMNTSSFSFESDERNKIKILLRSQGVCAIISLTRILLRQIPGIYQGSYNAVYFGSHWPRISVHPVPLWNHLHVFVSMNHLPIIISVAEKGSVFYESVFPGIRNCSLWKAAAQQPKPYIHCFTRGPFPFRYAFQFQKETFICKNITIVRKFYGNF